MDNINSNFDLNFLQTESELYNVFASADIIKLTNPNKLNYLLKQSGVDAKYSAAKLKNVRFFYWGAAGYTPEYKIYWLIVEIICADKKDIQDAHFIIYLNPESLNIDAALEELFDTLPGARVCAGIKEPTGKLEHLIEDAGKWFESFTDLYLSTAASDIETEQRQIKKAAKKKVDKKRDME